MHNLADNEIHVWWASLRVSSTRLAWYAATLHADEHARAARFRCEEHQKLFVAARGGLRELLSSYLDTPPIALRFNYAERGKPTLEGFSGVYFNLAHSAAHALYAVARCPVGVDLESMERTLDRMALAQRICTAREWAVFQTLPKETWQTAFFNCWTRKEALLKATGQGLSGGLQDLEVCFRADAELDGRVSMKDAAGQTWSVLSLPMPDPWTGALAAAGTGWQWILRPKGFCARHDAIGCNGGATISTFEI